MLTANGPYWPWGRWRSPCPEGCYEEWECDMERLGYMAHRSSRLFWEHLRFVVLSAGEHGAVKEGRETHL